MRKHFYTILSVLLTVAAVLTFALAATGDFVGPGG